MYRCLLRTGFQAQAILFQGLQVRLEGINMLQFCQGLLLHLCQPDISGIEVFNNFSRTPPGLHQPLIQFLQAVPDLHRIPFGLQDLGFQLFGLALRRKMSLLPAGLCVSVDDHEKQDDRPEPAKHHVEKGQAECVKRAASHVRVPE